MHDEVAPDNYFNPGSPVADFRVDSHGTAEILTERASVRQHSMSRGNDLTSDDGMIVVWGDEEYPL
jgi:hypothetical protein